MTLTAMATVCAAECTEHRCSVFGPHSSKLLLVLASTIILGFGFRLYSWSKVIKPIFMCNH
jgi:hypothetical protein